MESATGSWNGDPLPGLTAVNIVGSLVLVASLWAWIRIVRAANSLQEIAEQR
ncbi:hypothetical protein ACFFKU_10000 [Kineococcus gynurae]|uniref:Uncharacterized protein n=1 Tax=Kineococcus gynurae TaxID=452979 RepID=A0ABV5LV59_9ACTN